MEKHRTRVVAHYGAMAIEAMAAKLAKFTGEGAKPQTGCVLATMPWGESTALIEFEFQPAEGDGWNEPRHKASITAIQVLLNGVWCNPEEVATELQIAAWTEAAWELRADAISAAAESAAEARAEDRTAA